MVKSAKLSGIDQTNIVTVKPPVPPNERPSTNRLLLLP